ncbi:metallophosphoesterase [Nonomuraea sp. B12E4]|uniref:metallophosphoesterase n=1 Tax=Nonomuraea sp. B12E4 TaxID=3153564 RepID=UPI00325CF34C
MSFTKSALWALVGVAAAISVVVPQVAQAAPQTAEMAQVAQAGDELERITPAVDPSKPPQDQLVLAVIGDYGGCGVDRACASENQVADMVHSWNPAYILTVGDNTYQQGRPEEVVKAQAPYKADIDTGKFFPIMGNHDYGNGCNPESIKPSVDFFKVPVAFVAGFGNGLVDFLNPDVNCQSASGTAKPPIYNQYKNTVDNSTAAWVLSGGHQPIYSSGKAGNNPEKAWLMTPGVDLILAGHDHHAEHVITSDGYNIAITGNSGEGLTPLFSTAPGSVYREATDFGAMRLTVTKDSLKAEFVTLPDNKVDYYFILKKDAQGKAYVAERSDWVDPNPDPGQNPTPNKYSVSFDLAADKSDGLTYKNYDDGPIEETTVDGRKAIQLQKNSFGGANQLYMFVDDAAISGGPYAVKATFTYRSPVPGSFVLQYDSATSGSAYQKSAPVTISADQVNTWQTASIDIPDIRFTNRENGSADMRLSAAANLPLAVSGVKIDVAPPKPTVTHVSMDFSGEPNGLNWMPYESGPAHEITIDGRQALQVDKNTFNTGNNLYLVVDDKFIQGGPYDGTATIEYRSPVAGSFVLQYDSAATGSAYQSTPRVNISADQVNTWQTATLDMPQVMFRNRQNGDADMRIVGANNLPFIIGSMDVDIAGGEDEGLEDAQNAVAAAEAHPSAETIAAAEAAIAKLPAGPDADALTQRLDAVKAALDHDKDKDGINDDVDVTFPPGTSQANNPSNETFSDALAGGTTSGKILSRNGHTLTISDAHNPSGVQVNVGAGSAPAKFELAGSAVTIALAQGSYELTGSGKTSTIKTVDGEQAVVTVNVNGTPITLTVDKGGSVTYTETSANGKVTGLTGIQQTGTVGIRADGMPATACAGIAIQNVIVTTTGNDQISGTHGNDLIVGRGGNDTVNGNDGNDCVTTGSGNDKITTTGGDDWIDAGGGNNVVKAGDGTNAVTTGSGNDQITTGDGDDTVNAGYGNNTVTTGGGHDTITAGSGNDGIDCGADSDTAHAGGGNNTDVGKRCETFGI